MVCTDTVRESALEVDSGRKKIPRRTGDSNPRQYCAWLFSRTLYQLNYSLPEFVYAGSNRQCRSQSWITILDTNTVNNGYRNQEKNSQQRAHLFLQFTSLHGTEVYVLLLDSPGMHSDRSIRTRFPTQALLNNTLYRVGCEHL